MQYAYGEFDGSEFPTPDSLFSFDQLGEFILRHGEEALRAMEKLLREQGEQTSELLEQMLKEGMLERDAAGRLRLSPRAVGRMQRKALVEVFANLREGQREGHRRLTAGQGGERVEGTKPYEFGDPVSELDLGVTLRNAIHRGGIHRGADGRASIRFGERDFELHLREGTASCSTVVLIDLSGSMMRYGRFLAAKKVALAMQALVRERFAQDSIDFIGFYSGASRIPEMALPLVMPKPVTIYDYQVRLRVRLDQLDQAPQHFTNLHMGLQMARRLLRRRGGENKQIFVITDGQPTAHVEGDFVHLLYPPDRRSTMATLKEALLATREGCRISTFALIEDYWGMDWVSFVDQLTRLTRGVAFYTTGDDLASCVMESYLSGRKKKTHIA